MKLLSRPLRLLLDRRGTFETPLHVRSVAEARMCLARWERAIGMRPAEARLLHGTVINRQGEYVTQVRTERNS